MIRSGEGGEDEARGRGRVVRGSENQAARNGSDTVAQPATKHGAANLQQNTKRTREGTDQPATKHSIPPIHW